MSTDKNVRGDLVDSAEERSGDTEKCYDRSCQSTGGSVGHQEVGEGGPPGQ